MVFSSKDILDHGNMHPIFKLDKVKHLWFMDKLKAFQIIQPIIPQYDNIQKAR